MSSGVPNSSGLISTFNVCAPVVFTAGVGALTVNQSGCLVPLPVIVANSVLNLPAPQAGLNYRLVSTATLTNNVVVTATANIMKGVAYNNNAGVPAIILKTGAGAIITFTATSIAGDNLLLWSDGTSWFFNGFGGATASFS